VRRRDLIAGLGGAVTVGAAAAWHVGLGGTPPGETGGLGSDASESGNATVTDASPGIDPVTLPTVDAPGSPGEPVTVPVRGQVSVVTFFATWCHVCEAEMATLGTVHAGVEDVQFVSVTNEPVGHAVTREEVAAWWREHDGNWPVALDTDLELTDALDVSGVPRVFVLDADNTVTWRGKGHLAADDIERAVADAREAGSGR
jgi:thiol-disulfide isomerase/thioredoxin